MQYKEICRCDFPHIMLNNLLFCINYDILCKYNIVQFSKNNSLLIVNSNLQISKKTISQILLKGYLNLFFKVALTEPLASTISPKYVSIKFPKPTSYKLTPKIFLFESIGFN